MAKVRIARSLQFYLSPVINVILNLVVQHIILSPWFKVLFLCLFFTIASCKKLRRRRCKINLLLLLVVVVGLVEGGGEVVVVVELVVVAVVVSISADPTVFLAK